VRQLFKLSVGGIATFKGGEVGVVVKKRVGGGGGGYKG